MRIVLKEIKDLEQDLKDLAFVGFGFANKRALNQGVWVARKKARQNVRQRMTTRNNFTVNSIAVVTTKSIFIKDQEALIGSSADYMEKQEFGGINHKKGKYGIVIPTPYAAGEGMKKGPTTQPVERKNRLSRLRQAGKGKRIRSIGDARKAMGKRRKASMLIELGGKTAMYRVDRSKKRFDIRMLYDMSRTTTIVPRNPWLKPSVDATILLMPKIYRKHLIEQLLRKRTFKTR